MRLLLAAGLASGALLLSGCGQATEIAGQAATAAAGAATDEIQRQAGEVVGSAVGPLCQGLARADKSLAALAQGKAQTVAEAKQQIADAQADLGGDSAAESVAAQAVAAGITSALDGLAQTLEPLGNDALVPESVVDTAAGVSNTIGQAEDTLGC